MSSSSSNYVERNPRCSTDPIEYEGVVRIDDPALLFDLPVDAVIEQFKKELEKQHADKTWENDYDRFDIFQVKAERAIQNVVDHTDPRVEQCSAPGTVAENIGPQAEQHYETGESIAEAWIREWLQLYNSILQSLTGNEIDELKDTIATATENEAVSLTDLSKAATHFISNAEA